MENNILLTDFKGQKGQDKWVVNEILNMQVGGYFLDLAAANGILHSNTFVLEKHLGWNGLCIEPNPYFFEELIKNRECQFANVAISDSADYVDFRVDNGQLGGVVADDTDNNHSIRGDELKSAEILRLSAKCINDVLQENSVPNYIDYFSLDVEGCEERIISTLDFKKYEFGCITIERPTPKVNEIILANGYIFVKNFKFDTFYITPKIQETLNIKCDEFEQIPSKEW